MEPNIGYKKLGIDICYSENKANNGASAIISHMHTAAKKYRDHKTTQLGLSALLSGIQTDGQSWHYWYN